MVQGAGRPGRPNPGQQSIFGNGGPSFAQMPSYSPVTRGGPQPAAPQPAPAQPAAAQPAPQPAPAALNPMPQSPMPQSPVAPAAPAPQAYTGGQPLSTPQPQAYTAPAAPETSGGASALSDFGAVDPGFPDSIFGDVKLGGAAEEPSSPLMTPRTAPLIPEPAADAAFSDAAFPEAAAPADDAAFPEAAAPVAAAPEAAHHDAYAAAQPEAYAAHHQPQPEAYAAQPQPEAYAAAQPQAYAGHQPVPGVDDPALYAQHPGVHQPAPYGHVPPADPHQQLQTVDPHQHPEIALGGAQAGMQPGQQEYGAAMADPMMADTMMADAMGEADFVEPGAAVVADAGLKAKIMQGLKGKSTVMVVSALLGAVALGGALAFAYKQSGGDIGENAPIVTADASPVKAAPDAPGGKQFPHKNKLIYDRLTNGAMVAGGERLVPRQEDVAVPALPPATATAGLPSPVATTNPAGPNGARKVQTMVVSPDGTVQGAAAAAPPAVPAQPNMMPVPAIQQPAGQQVATAAPAAAAAAAPAAAATGSYVVQLGSSKSQTDALANFADAQQKYPSILGNYQPLVRKTDLGPKGTWYRLQVGPLADKSAAYKLCGQLKANGHSDCLVMAQ